jgi:DeoR/GlpR family transcriptional regulator of sugar metabolism
MNSAQRRNLIRRQVEGTAGVSTAQLQDLLGVSAMTVWRDLEALERAGTLRRVHGGAVPVDDAAGPEPSFAAKATRAAGAKQRIARYAVSEFVRPGMLVAMDGGSTVAALMPFFPAETSISIVTNSLEIVRQAPAGPSVHCSGGLYREVSGTFVGPQALVFLGAFRPDLAFVSGTALDVQDGLMDPNPLEIEVKRALCRRAGRTVLLLDSGKFGRRGGLRALDLAGIDVLLTEAPPEDGLKGELERAGVELRVVGSIPA